jgi:putative oxidoreductase
MSFLALIGRILFSAIFIVSGLKHFTPESINYAASQGLEYANILVPLSGIIALLGGLSILLGYYTRIGALLIILFLIPVTIKMHNFWDVTDPAAAHLQQIMFMKNLGLLGGAFLLSYFGAGPLSVDNKG